MAARARVPSVVILMYHSVVEDPRLTQNTIGISQSRSDFEAHVKVIAQKFNPVTIEQVTRFAAGDCHLPANSLAVTFDDGFLDKYQVVLPILARHGVPATFYLMVDSVDSGIPPWYCRLNFSVRTTQRIGRADPEYAVLCGMKLGEDRAKVLQIVVNECARKVGKEQAEFVRRLETALDVEPLGPESRLMLRCDEVRELRKLGHTIGGHTLSHPNLSHVSKEQALSEIFGYKRRLEQELGEPVAHFSYPHPALNPQWTPCTLSITREAGFQSAVLTTCGPVRFGDELLAMKRIYAASDLDQCLEPAVHIPGQIGVAGQAPHDRKSGTPGVGRLRDSTFAGWLPANLRFVERF